MPINQEISLSEARRLFKTLTGQTITTNALRYLAPGTTWGIWNPYSASRTTLVGVNPARFAYTIKARLALGFAEPTPGNILGRGDHMPGDSTERY